MTQDTYLFNSSIRFNLTLSENKSSDDEINANEMFDLKVFLMVKL